MGDILMPVMISPRLNPVIEDQFSVQLKELLNLMGDRVDLRVDEAEYPKAYPEENYWGRFARMRQSCINQFLTDDHDWVLWIDADIIQFPPTLFHDLRDTDMLSNVVSPLVAIEGNPGINYDTAGTRPDFGSRSGMQPPEPGVYKMFSVGGCVLVPAPVHQLVEFQAQADNDLSANTEWTSLCEGARKMGYDILWNTNVVVFHADLPKYGEGWH